jgi:membrane protease YdiL (CAAX protease family)
MLVCVMIPFNFTIETLNSRKGLFFSQVAEFFAVTLSVFLARRFLDKRSFSSLGVNITRYLIADISAGFGIPFLMIGLIFLTERLMGWATVTGYAWNTDSLLTVFSQTLFVFLTYVLVGWNEELLSRGYQLQTLASGLNITWGVILSSAVFGVLHLGNFNATWRGAVGVFFAGLFLAYAYVLTGQLWLSIGLHIGWNFFEGVVFGFPVSGMGTYQLIQTAVNGPELWTGGAFGPEGGLVLIPALILGGLLIYFYTRNRTGVAAEEAE